MLLVVAVDRKSTTFGFAQNSEYLPRKKKEEEIMNLWQVFFKQKDNELWSGNEVPFLQATTKELGFSSQAKLKAAKEGAIVA